MPLPTSPTGVFPLYLFPSNPFRRRTSSATPAVPSESATAFSSSAPPSQSYLSGSLSILRCNRCLAHICPTSSIISKGFNGRWGRAFLVSPPAHSLGTLTPPCEVDETNVARHHQAGNLPNTHVHKPQPRMLVTGAHTVSDISCVKCGSMLGWKYVDAEEEGQKYKVGNFILEMKRVMRSVDWENDNEPSVDIRTASENGPKRRESHARKDSGVEMMDEIEERHETRDEVEFDSEDEDECEDLFMGIWSPQLAKKRRRAKAWKDERDL